MLDRIAVLRQFTFHWPPLDAAFAAGAMRAAMLLLVLTGALWLMFGVYKKLNTQRGVG
jgi:hypothetical protein